MLNRLTNLITMVALSAAAGVNFPTTVMAQTTTVSEPIQLESIPDVFERAFFNESELFFDNITIPRQLDYIFGIGTPTRASFPENEISRDGELVHILYRDIFEQQVSSGPIYRTPDLPSPFNASLRTEPSFLRANQPVVGGEFVFERLPLR